MTPWLWRNWRLTGGLIFDDPASQTMVLAQRYSGLNFEDVIPYLPGETDSQYSSRMLRIALDGIRQNPGAALHSMANHFLNNEIDNVLLLPLRSDLHSLSELWQPTRAFWQDWNGQPTPGQSLLLAVYLGLLSLGLAACWRAAGWAGLLPLGINLGYNLWTGLFRSSGERFLVPVRLDRHALFRRRPGHPFRRPAIPPLTHPPGYAGLSGYPTDPHPPSPRTQSGAGGGVQTPSPAARSGGGGFGRGSVLLFPRPDHLRPGRQPAAVRTHPAPPLPAYHA